jgi:poly-gamma-glutamate capsule biosynthesis protein CapA/YwtB (metallophosphatase superfamily)
MEVGADPAAPCEFAAPGQAAPPYEIAARCEFAVPQLSSRRVRRNRILWALNLLLLASLVAWYLVSGGGDAHHTASDVIHSSPIVPPTPIANLDPDWDGDGEAVTLAFGGDVHFPAGTNLGRRLTADPATALGPTVPALLSGANLSMVNLESALTDGTCPDPQPKQYVYDAPASAITAFEHAGVTLITESNNHGEDCGPGGLQMAIQARSGSGYPVLGIGQNVTEAFTPYRATINGERIVIIAATQVIDAGLQTVWTATASQPGLASAYDVGALVAAVEAARKEADTVVVYLHWGTEQQDCPNPLQEPLAQLLVKAGADIVVGTHAHVLLGGGYLGRAYVDYGLGNFAFYDNSPPENESGSLLITVTGRHIDGVTWRPAVIEDDLPQPLTGAAATQALTAWNQARACTDVTATPGPAIASPVTETAPPTPVEEQELSQDND